jgi:hypothetical protein
MIDNYDWDRLSGLYPAEFVEKMKGLDGKACWKGYKQMGTKQKGGKTVDNCVKMSNHSEDETADFGAERIKKYLRRNDYEENPINQMTPNSLPEEPGEGDEKNPEMGENGVPIRMPRMEVIKKAMNKNGSLAMRAEPNYSETEDFIESHEPNGGMAINQLRVMREKIDIMLGMLYPDDNLEPWMATKLANSSQNLASVADYLRFGVET